MSGFYLGYLKDRSFPPSKCPASPPQILSLQYISNCNGKIIQTRRGQCVSKCTRLHLNANSFQKISGGGHACSFLFFCCNLLVMMRYNCDLIQCKRLRLRSDFPSYRYEHFCLSKKDTVVMEHRNLFAQRRSQRKVSLKVARLDFLGSMLPHFKFLPRRHQQKYRKKVTQVALYKDDNLLWSMFYWHQSYHGNIMRPLRFLLAFVFLGTRSFFQK